MEVLNDKDLISWKVDMKIDKPSIPSREMKLKKDLEMLNKQKEYGEKLSRKADDYNNAGKDIKELETDIEKLEKEIKVKMKKAKLLEIIKCIRRINFSQIDNEENKNIVNAYESEDKILSKSDLMRRIEVCLNPIIDNFRFSKEVSDRVIKNFAKIVEIPYEEAWIQDYMNLLQGLEEYQNEFVELFADENKKFANKLVKAINDRDKFRDFICFPREQCKISVDYREKKETLSKLFSTAQDNIEKECKDIDFEKVIIDLSEKHNNAKMELNKKIRLFEDKNIFQEKSKIALKNYKSNSEIISKMRDKLDKDIKEQNNKNEWEYEYKGVKIIVRNGDLTEEYSTAIVNPTDEYLRHEGGLPRVIAEKAGDNFTLDCYEYIDKYSKLATGNATTTSAGGSLNCDMIIHTVGPKYKKGSPDNSLAISQLKQCIDQILNIVKEKDVKSI